MQLVTFVSLSRWLFTEKHRRRQPKCIKFLCFKMSVAYNSDNYTNVLLYLSITLLKRRSTLPDITTTLNNWICQLGEVTFCQYLARTWEGSNWMRLKCWKHAIKIKYNSYRQRISKTKWTYTIKGFLDTNESFKTHFDGKKILEFATFKYIFLC